MLTFLVLGRERYISLGVYRGGEHCFVGEIALKGLSRDKARRDQTYARLTILITCIQHRALSDTFRSCTLLGPVRVVPSRR
jgi:hypothetical protein